MRSSPASNEGSYEGPSVLPDFSLHHHRHTSCWLLFPATSVSVCHELSLGNRRPTTSLAQRRPSTLVFIPLPTSEDRGSSSDTPVKTLLTRFRLD
jgi:hypothetical protein